MLLIRVGLMKNVKGFGSLVWEGLTFQVAEFCEKHKNIEL